MEKPKSGNYGIKLRGLIVRVEFYERRYENTYEKDHIDRAKWEVGRGGKFLSA